MTTKLGCLSAFSAKKRAAARAEDHDMGTPSRGVNNPSNANAQPLKPALRTRKPDSAYGSSDSPHSARSASPAFPSADVVVVLQDFRPGASDELPVRRGQRLRLLYLDGDWAYVCTCTGVGDAHEAYGFVPAYYCRRMTTDDIEQNQRRMVTFAHDHIRADSLTRGESPAKRPPSGLPNPYHSQSSGLHLLACRRDSDASYSSLTSADYVELRSPTAGEKRVVRSGYPYAARVLYNFSDEAVDHVCVRRGEDVVVLGRENSEWCMVQRRNGQQGLMPSCFLQSERSADSPNSTLKRSTLQSWRNSFSSSPDGSDRSHTHVTSGRSVGLSQLPASAPFSNLQLTRNWLEEHGRYAIPQAGSPSHSSSDSGFVASPNTLPASDGSHSSSRTPTDDFPEPPDCVLFPECEYVEVAGDSDEETKNMQTSTKGPPVPRRPTVSNGVSGIAAQIAINRKKEQSQDVLQCSPHAAAGIRRAIEQLQRANANSNMKKTRHNLSDLDVDEDDEQLLVVCDFEAAGKTQLTVKKGDLVMGNTSQAAGQRGWLWALLLRSGQRGFIPAAYTQPCKTDTRGDIATQL